MKRCVHSTIAEGCTVLTGAALTGAASTGPSASRPLTRTSPHQSPALRCALIVWVSIYAAAAFAADEQLAAWHRLVPTGAPVSTVLSVAAMVTLPTPADGDYVILRGYHQPGDDGGGVFRYEPTNTEPADGGTILKARAAVGRYVRVLDRQGEPLAEWYGARGDGDSAEPHDDQDAINTCLNRFGRVKLLAKIYGVRGKPAHYDPNITYNAIDLGPGFRIEGSGRDGTTIKLLDGSNPKGSAPGNNYFSVIANRRFHESADYAVVRDLTVDCNFDGQNKHTTIHALSMRGGGGLVERANLRGYGTGRHPETGSSREAFVVNQTLVYKDADGCRQAATFRDLDFTDPGHNGDVGGQVAEITHIGIGGAQNFGNYSWILPKGHDPDFDPANDGENENNWWPSYGGLVERCTIHDESYDPAVQQSPLHGITYSNCIGMVVRSNRVTDFEGAGVYVMSWWNRDTTITGNEFANVSSGLALQIKGKDGTSIQNPRHENVRFEGNTVKLCAPKHHRWAPVGVQLYGQDLKGIRFKNILVRGNRIAGQRYVDAQGEDRFPLGISVQILRANYENLVFEDNTIVVPDYPPSAHVPQQPYSMSMRFFPLARWEQDSRSGNVIFRGNRNENGDQLRPILADWYFKNKPTWGDVPKPD